MFVLGTIPEKPPIIPDKHKLLEDPFSLNQWLAENRTMIEREGRLNIFGEEANYQFKVRLHRLRKCCFSNIFLIYYNSLDHLVEITDVKLNYANKWTLQSNFFLNKLHWSSDHYNLGRQLYNLYTIYIIIL